MSLFLTKLDLRNKKVLDFPDVRQSRSYTCGASALQAILYYYGLSFREDELEALLHIDPKNGTAPRDIVRLCQHFALNVDEKQHMTIADLKSYLKRKIPVLVTMQAWNNTLQSYHKLWNSGHYSVVIGIISDFVIFEDPSLIGRGVLTINEFMDRWHDIDKYGHHYINYGIAIYGKRIKYHSDRLTRIL